MGHDPSKHVSTGDLLQTDGPLQRAVVEALESEADPHAVMSAHLAEHGHDGLVYNNRYEGGGDSYIATKPGTVRSSTTGDVLFANSDKASPIGSALRVASQYAGGELPMDLESRMARAREMGFDVDRPLWHQTHRDNVSPIMNSGFDINKVGARRHDEQMPNGVFLKDSDRDISVGASGDEAAQIPLHARLKNPARFADRDALAKFLNRDPAYRELAEEVNMYDKLRAADFNKIWHDKSIPYEQKQPLLDSNLAETEAGLNTKAAAARERATQLLRDAGHDGLVMDSDQGGLFNKRKVPTTVVFDANNLRHVNAAFDPSRSHSANLLASNPDDIKAAIPGTVLRNGSEDPVQRALQVARSEGDGSMASEEKAYRDRFLPETWYHGSSRIDRVIENGKIEPKRATSGPMPFFTDDPQIASNYATGKKDTSLENMWDDVDNSRFFTVSPKDLGRPRERTPYSVEQTWNALTPEQRAEILKKAPRVGYEDRDMAEGPFVLHPEGTHGGNSSASHWNDTLQRHRGNPLAALRDVWLDSGSIFDTPHEMSDIYRLAGYPHPISQTYAPWTTANGVLPAKLRIERPLRTDQVDTIKDKVIPALEQAFKRDRSRKVEAGADSWDKNSRYTPKEWVAQLRDDIAKGENSYVWTSIPDKVTAELQRLGYDGIIDTGGKGGGAGHQVTVPFKPNQVRSPYAKFDPEKSESSNLLALNPTASTLPGTVIRNGKSDDAIKRAMDIADDYD